MKKVYSPSTPKAKVFSGTAEYIPSGRVLRWRRRRTRCGRGELIDIRADARSVREQQVHRSRGSRVKSAADPALSGGPVR
ncbi:hypothetical protein CSOJ01_05027 [Colletotrichum sojae]|uniref:Uncharacterized protein n=1 Tax=Colletotrichum sojae TaxID=2175907 RepID=A0A8H6JGM8_9PEZI|nr:hypothetical protein CSOJ01_05027 [Colletotrichum sojae]